MKQRYVVRHGRRIAVETIETGVIPRRRRTDLFVKVPLSWIEQATQATKTPKALVCIWLLHLAWKTKSHTFALPNSGLRKRGVNRLTKYRVLRELEIAGLITVERHSRRTPLVTLISL